MNFDPYPSSACSCASTGSDPHDEALHHKWAVPVWQSPFRQLPLAPARWLKACEKCKLNELVESSIFQVAQAEFWLGDRAASTAVSEVYAHTHIKGSTGMMYRALASLHKLKAPYLSHCLCAISIPFSTAPLGNGVDSITWVCHDFEGTFFCGFKGKPKGVP